MPCGRRSRTGASRGCEPAPGGGGGGAPPPPPRGPPPPPPGGGAPPPYCLDTTGHRFGTDRSA
ncbi:hypothetical protein ABID95_000001, partial [Streptomyces atratus]